MLLTLLSACLLVAGLVLLAPTTVFLIEVMSGDSVIQPLPATRLKAGIRAGIVVPAHNESLGISTTLGGLRAQMEAGDILMVVADNCTDNTAEVARKAGATVTERFDAEKRGKGYALAHGIAELARYSPDVLVIVDADCMLSPDVLRSLKSAVAETGMPAQALYHMGAPPGYERRYAVATFAWRVKNLLRPLGLAHFNGPSHLMGTGMAFPFNAISTAQFSSGNIVEDLELGLNLAERRLPARLERRAAVHSVFPVTAEGEIAQRRRWESGSLTMLLTRGVATVAKAVMTMNWPLMALGFDMLVPPLITHAALLLLFAVVCLVASPFVMLPLLLAVALLVAFGLAIGLSWMKVGQDVLPPAMWLSLGSFILKKSKIHGASKSGKEWVRADRRQDEN